MNDSETSDDQATDASRGSPETPKGQRQAFSRMRRSLTEEEESNPLLSKILMDDVDRLERECDE